MKFTCEISGGGQLEFDHYFSERLDFSNDVDQRTQSREFDSIAHREKPLYQDMPYLSNLFSMELSIIFGTDTEADNLYIWGDPYTPTCPLVRVCLTKVLRNASGSGLILYVS